MRARGRKQSGGRPDLSHPRTVRLRQSFPPVLSRLSPTLVVPRGGGGQRRSRTDFNLIYDPFGTTIPEHVIFFLFLISRLVE